MGKTREARTCEKVLDSTDFNLRKRVAKRFATANPSSPQLLALHAEHFEGSTIFLRHIVP